MRDVMTWMVMVIITLVYVGERIESVTATGSFMSPENRLFQDLMVNYNRNVRPVRKANSQIKVKATFSLRKLENLNEKSQVMTTFGWMALVWNDELLRWNPRDYNGTYRLVVSSSQIWIPEIAMFNSVEQGNDLALSSMFRASIFSNGTVLWGPGFKWQTGCSVNLLYFPFDTQRCNVSFISWMHGEELISFSVGGGVKTVNMEPNEGWRLLGARSGAELLAPGGGRRTMKLPMIFFELTLRRRPTYFLVHVVVPVVLIALLSALVFLLPSQAGEKVSLSVTVFLAYTVVLLMVSEVTPKSGETLPFITVYIIMSMGQTGLSLALTIWILSVRHHSPDRPVPGCLRSLVLGCMSAAIRFNGCRRRPNIVQTSRVTPQEKDTHATRENLAMGAAPTKTINDENDEMACDSILPDDVIAYIRRQMAQGDEHLVEQRYQAEWEEVASVLDQFCLYTFLLLTLIEVIGFGTCVCLNPDMKTAP